MPASELSVFAERFICAPSQHRADTFKSLIWALRQAIQSGNVEDAAAVLGRIVSPTLDYTSALSLCRIQAQLRSQTGIAGQKVRLAVLGSFTTTQLVSLCDLFLFSAGIVAEIYEADYSVFRQEIFDPESELYRFKPQIVYLATSWSDLVRRPHMNCTSAELAQIVADEQAEWHALWDTLQKELGCQVIQNNFVMPPLRAFANFELRQPGSLNRFLFATNLHLADYAPPFVTIHDVDHLASLWGRWSWSDPRFVHQAKLPCSPEYLVDYAHSVASLIGTQLGSAKKCLVLDLDNTLWGGVIGDDGLGGIHLGQGDPEGEAFSAFQHYAKGLQQRGVILAVCSKNNEATARDVFENHSEMVLRLKDISCFVANWDDKPTNLRTIASTLNIGLNSLVFVDDNPAERAIVRQLVPEVAVPELPEDVTAYPQVLDQHRYFQVISVATEDFQRTDYYRADSLRKSAEASASDLEGYLRSLEMTARIGPIDPTSLDRSVQLIYRSNQFNLTTHRWSAAEVLALLGDDSWITRTVSLTDRFGDNGLISVLIAHITETAIEIDTWLMSCRVLKRGVEQFLLNHLIQLARSRGVPWIRGEYIPTQRNSLVRHHYSSLGFTCTGADPDGRTSWELVVSDELPLIEPFITEVPIDGFVRK